jgi:hypothetical protein
MTADENILKEQDGYRVRLEPDTDITEPDTDITEPDDDAAWPVLRIEPRSYAVTHMNQGSSRPHDLDEAVENAVSHWATSPADSDWKLLEKWLRAYLGVTRIETWYSETYWYVAYDSAAWREWAGAPAGLGTEDPLADIRAWVEGDGWGWVIEKRVTWTAAVSDGPFSERFGPDTRRDSWEEVASCWGYYGSTYATERALEEFSAALAGEEGETGS